MVINPTITEVTEEENGCKLALFIPKDLKYFSGHFNGSPILAGVVQLDWAIKFAQEYLSFDSFIFDRVEVLKFQVIIQPEDNVILELIKVSENKFKFSYISNKGKHALGRVILK